MSLELDERRRAMLEEIGVRVFLPLDSAPQEDRHASPASVVEHAVAFAPQPAPAQPAAAAKPDPGWNAVYQRMMQPR